MATMGLLKGHHTLSVLGSLNEKEMGKKKRKNERKNNIGRWSGKDKSVGGAVSSRHFLFTA